MANPSELEEFAAAFENELSHWLPLFSSANRTRITLGPVTIRPRADTFEVRVLLYCNDRSAGPFGYRITQEEFSGQSIGDIGRAAYLSWLDIESELLGLINGEWLISPDSSGIVWMSED